MRFFGKGQSWNEKGYQGGKDGEKKPWQKGSGKKGSKWQEKGGKGETRACWTRVARQETLQRGVEKEATTTCTPLVKMTVKTLKN